MKKIHFLIAWVLLFSLSGFAQTIGNTQIEIPSASNPPLPPSISLVKIDSQTVCLNLIPNTENNEVLLLCHTSINKVKPSGILSVDDTLSNGAKVIYKGLAKESICFEGLPPSSPYYFSAWSFMTQGDEPIYSSESGEQNVHTWVTGLPMLWDFNKEKDPFEVDKVPPLPAGWRRLIENATTDNFRIMCNIAETETFMQGFVHYNDSKEDIGQTKSIDIITPIVCLEQGMQRLIFDYNFCNSGWMEEFEVYMLEDSDSLCVQVSYDGNDFKTIYTLNKDNYIAGSTFAKTNFFFNSTRKQNVNFRFVYHSKNMSAARLDNIKIEKVPDCDYPTDLIVIDSTITTSSASISWTENNDNTPSSWNARFRVTGTEMWSEIQSMANKSAVINGLPPQSYIEIQIQSVCSINSISPWSATSPAFLTQYSIPFTCDFSNWDPMWQYTGTIMSHWGETTGIFTDTGFIVNPTNKSSNWKIGNWRARTGTAAYSCDFAKNTAAWFLSPIFDLGNEQANSMLAFDFSLNPPYKTQSVDSINSQARFLVAISTDGGKTFKNENIVASWGKGSSKALANLDSVNVNIDLGAYRGEIRIGFYVENPLAANQNKIFVDNLAVTYSCGRPENLGVSDIGEDSVKLNWLSPNKGNAWIVRYRKDNETNYQYFGTQNTNAILHGLTPETDYMWSVAEICKIGDTSIWVNNSFTTLATYKCDTVLGLKMASVGRFEVSLKWESEAEQYRVAYKQVDESMWHFANTDTNFITITSLLSETRYTYRVKAQCSKEASDTSIWTNPRFFSTLINTCIAPQNVKVSNIKINSASISFTSNVDNFQLSLREKDQAENFIFIGQSDIPYSLSDLRENTAYILKIRTICGLNDTSAWSDEVNFTTIEGVECKSPTNLSVNDITHTSAKLNWEKEIHSQAWNICYKIRNGNEWDTIIEHAVNSYNLSNLSSESTYDWKVQAVCENSSKSIWVEGANFNTLPLSIEGSENTQIDFIVSAENGSIHIQNIKQLKIDRVEVHGIMGQMEFSDNVRSRDHIRIKTSFSQGVRIVRLYSQKQVFNYKIFVK